MDSEQLAQSTSNVIDPTFESLVEVLQQLTTSMIGHTVQAVTRNFVNNKYKIDTSLRLIQYRIKMSKK